MREPMQPAVKSKRIDITLPVQTIDQIDGVWRDWGFSSRSAFLDEAAKSFAARLKKANLKQALKAGYKTRAQRDTEMNRELEALSGDL